MSNATSRRATAILAILLLLLPGVGEALGRTCEHHDGSVWLAQTTDEHAGGDVHEGHAHADPAHAHHVHSPAEPGHDHHSEACTCPGTCAAGSGAAAPTTPTTSMQLVATADRSRAIPTAPERSPRLLPFVLPYAQAPPVGC